MKNFFAWTLVCILVMCASSPVLAQCSTTDATTCSCPPGGGSDCDLLPDIWISWSGLQNISGGPSEYSQTDGTNPGRLRISGATPNQGWGPLEVSGKTAAGYRTFICGTDTVTIYDPTGNSGFTCSNGYTPRQILYQRIYHKNGNTMTYNEVQRGSMTYHTSHGHFHVNGWTTMTLRLAQPGVSDPRQWPISATGGKLGFCLTNLFTCSTTSGYCRTSNLYGQGTALGTSAFPNYNLGVSYGCSAESQSITVGKGDIYDETLDGMWINLLPGLCNGQYYIVAEADPYNDFLETDDSNNWTYIPFTISQQTAAGAGGSANINCSGRLVMAPGESRTLTASAGTAYAWSTGATTRSITVTTAGTYSCTVTCPCGSLSTPSLTLTSLAAPAAPTGTGATVLVNTSAALNATGSNVHWFDAATNGSEVGIGNAFNTPALPATTNYWAEDWNVSAGVNSHVGKPDNSGSGAYNSSKQWLLFDAYQPFVLQSFKVYASGIGTRHFVLVDQLGNLIAEHYQEIPNGESVITVNWNVPAGTQHKITAYDDNTEVVRNLWRSDGGVSYPYPLSGLGSITGSTGGSSLYYYLYDWVVRTPDVIAKSARTMVTATVTNGVQVSARVKLEGPFDSGTGLMNDQLRTAVIIPSTEPYTGLGFGQVFGGGETVTPSLLTVTGNDAIVDWVRLELRSAADPASIVATQQALVQRDGDVVSGSGLSTLTFPVAPGNYYLAVRHRNHLGCMTATTSALGSSPTSVDFSSAGTATWGTNARKSSGGSMVLWSGNVILDGQLLYTGAGNDRDPILAAIGGVVPTSTTNGYAVTDCTLDGVTKYTGAGNDRDLILSNIGGVVPTSSRVEQLP